MADAVGRRQVAAIGDGVSALNGLPCGMLLFAQLCAFGWMPPDGSGIEQDLSALQGSETRRFRVPLVPTNQHADLSVTRLPAAEPKIAGSEIKLLVIKR